MSSGLLKSLGRPQDGRVDLSSNVAFETADDVAYAQSLRGSTSHVCSGPRVMTLPDDDNAIERRVGLTVATGAETMPVGLAG